MQRVVSVCTRWGDYVLSVRDVRRGESLSVGSPPERLVSFRSGTPSVCALPSGKVEQQRPLGPGQSVTVTRDGLDYTLSCFGSDETPSFAPRGRRWVALVDALVLGLLFLALRHVAPTNPVVRATPQAPAERAAQPLQAPEEVEPSHDSIFAVLAEPLAELVELPGDMRCGDAEPGSRAVADARGRYGMAGPRDNPDPHMSRPVMGHGFPTASGVVASLGVPLAPSGSAGPTAYFGRDTALGSDAQSARGTMWRDEVDEETGQEGLGFVRRVGGVAKVFEVAALLNPPLGELRVLHTGLRVSGPRKPSEVARTLAAHFDDFRACAQASALPEPGRVQLELDVAEDGRASASGKSANALEQCLEQRLSGVVFAAGARAPTHVVYPLFFTAANAKLHHSQAAPPPAVPCDCG